MKRTLKLMFRSALICFFCITMLTSSTYAWITESVNQSGKNDGNPYVELYWSENYYADSSDWHTESYNNVTGRHETDKLFKIDQGENGKWEPGHTQVRYIQFMLKDSQYGMTYEINVDRNGMESIGDPNLAQAIEVYFVENVSQPITKSYLSTLTPEGTLAELCIGRDSNGQEVHIRGSLTNNVSKNCALVLHMKESAGNTYQDMAYDFNLTFDVNQNV